MFTHRRLVVIGISGQPLGPIFKKVEHSRSTCYRKIVLWILDVGLLIVWIVATLRPAHRSFGIAAWNCKRYWSDKIMNLHTDILKGVFFYHRTQHFRAGGVIGSYAETMSSALRRTIQR